MGPIAAACEPVDLVAAATKREGGLESPPSRSCSIVRSAQPLAIPVRGGLTLPVEICFAQVLSLAISADAVRRLRADLAVADAAVLHVEDTVDAALVLAVLHQLDRLRDACIDLLRRARQHLRAEERLVVVDADAPGVRVRRRPRWRRGRSRRRPGRRRRSPDRSGRERPTCTCPARRSPASSR